MRDLFIVDGPGSEVHGHAYQADRKRLYSRVADFSRVGLARLTGVRTVLLFSRSFFMIALCKTNLYFPIA